MYNPKSCVRDKNNEHQGNNSKKILMVFLSEY